MRNSITDRLSTRPGGVHRGGRLGVGVEVWGNYRRIDRLRISASPMPTSLVTFLFGHKKVILPHFQLRLCHCEEGKSGAPDVAISWYYLSKYAAVSKHCTGRLHHRHSLRSHVALLLAMTDSRLLNITRRYISWKALPDILGCGLGKHLVCAWP